MIGGLADFITKARIGIQAQPVSREAGKIAMRISTDMTGSPDGEPILSFEDRPDGQHSEGITSYYGLNRIVQNPENASLRSMVWRNILCPINLSLREVYRYR